MKPVSILIPVKGGRSVRRTVDSILKQNLDKFEILILRNGEKIGRPSDRYKRIGLKSGQVIRQHMLRVSGKAAALNCGIDLSKYDLVAVIDADCELEGTALKIVLQNFDKAEIIAVAGRICVRNGNRNVLTQIQALEYKKVFEIIRPVVNRLNADFLISGAFGVFRKELLKRIGGYKIDTVGEDMDLVLRMQELIPKTTYRSIIYEKKAVCYTDVPYKLPRLLRQRDRWHRGLLDSMIMNRKMILNPCYGLLGMVILPYQILFELMGPVFMIIAIIGIDLLLIPEHLTILFVVYELALNAAIVLKPDGTHIAKGKWFSKLITLPFITVACMLLTLITSIARIYGMITYHWRKNVW